LSEYLHTPPEWRPNWCELEHKRQKWSFLCINCNASTAVREHRIGGYSKEPQTGNTLGVIREPFERLYNNWTHPMWTEMFPTLESLVANIETLHDLEAHIRPQSWSFDPLMPKTIFKFHEVNDRFAEIGITLRKNPDKEATELNCERFFTDDQAERVRKAYSRDFELWGEYG